MFIFCIFYLNEKEQVCLIKYVENKMSNSTSHKKRERGAKTIQVLKHF